MSFKIIGLAVFIAGVLGLAYLLFFTGKSSKKPVGEKGDRKPTLDELFPIDEVTGERIYQQDDPDSVIVSDNELTPAIYVGYKRHKFLLPRDASNLYSRLIEMFADQYAVAPRVRVTDIIQAEEKDFESQSLDVKSAMQFMSRMNFNFVLSDVHSGEIVLVMLTEERLADSGNSAFLIGLLSQLNIPLYRYERLADISDNDLAIDIAETISGGQFE
ncbi:DUF2726 domain-containing protein [Moellerella wisconsensis]|uniref:DUF2726 domain-containing protein n=1 Tax=Moellerella wisconsensis TaxID=158849 RepID=UPI003AADB637